jgi:hypothetical protein
MAAAPVKAPESLADSQMRQLDNQVLFSMRGCLCKGRIDCVPAWRSKTVPIS